MSLKQLFFHKYGVWDEILGLFQKPVRHFASVGEIWVIILWAIFSFKKERESSAICRSREFFWLWGHINSCSSHCLLWWGFGPKPQWSVFLAHMEVLSIRTLSVLPVLLFSWRICLSNSRPLNICSLTFAEVPPNVGNGNGRRVCVFMCVCVEREENEPNISNTHMSNTVTTIHKIPEGNIGLENKAKQTCIFRQIVNCCPKLQCMWCPVRSQGFCTLPHRGATSPRELNNKDCCLSLIFHFFFLILYV